MLDTITAKPVEGSEAINLHNLPSDVFASLTAGFDLEALKTLRGVSQSLNAAATNELFTKCFAQRTIDLSTKSLNDLVGLCSSEFGKYVGRITIKACYYRLDDLETQLKERKKWVSEGGNGPIFASTQRDLTADELTERKSEYEAFKAAIEDQTALKADGKGIDLLTAAFRALGKQSLSIKLEAAQFRESLSTPLPARNLFGKLEDEMQNVMNDALKTTMSAIARSSMGVGNLEIFGRDQAGHVSLEGLYESFTLDAPDSPGSTSLSINVGSQLRGLKTLHLSISPPPYTEVRARDHSNYDDLGDHKPTATPELHAAYLTTLRAILTACPDLKELDIRLRGSSSKCHEDIITLLSDLPPLPELETFHLRGPNISAASLINIINSSPNLVTIGFHHVSLAKDPAKPEDKEQWLPVFSALTSLSKLETFETDALYTSSSIIFPCSPKSALERIRKDDYRRRIYFEGCPCVTFTGDEVRGTQPASGTSCDVGIDADDQTPDYMRNFEFGAPTGIEEDGPLDVDEIGTAPKHHDTRLARKLWDAVVKQRDAETDQPKEALWTPIRYKIGKRRPLGSPWLYRWMQVGRWEYALF